MRLSRAALSNRPDTRASQKHATDAAAMESFTCCIRVAYSAVQSPTEVSSPTYRKNKEPKISKEGERQLPPEPVSGTGGKGKSLRIVASHNPIPAMLKPTNAHGTNSWRRAHSTSTGELRAPTPHRKF